jgi:hypothetical protein
MKKVILALSVIAAPRAHASSCHGGGGGGGGGGSSSGGGGGGGGSYSSSSSSDGGSSTSSACTESTDIEGYRECQRFGMWAVALRLPRITIETGMAVRRFADHLAGASGSVTHGDERFTYRVVMPGRPEALDTTVSWTARGTVGSRHLYAGLEVELGGVASSAPAGTQMESVGAFGNPTLTQDSGIEFGAYGVAGVRMSSTHGAVAAELAGGVRTISYQFASTYHDCQQLSMIDDTRGVVEARVRGELWISPWLAVGATVGNSVIARDDWMAGVYLSAHSRAYGGL